jgi:hypothetical protein
MEERNLSSSAPQRERNLILSGSHRGKKPTFQLFTRGKDTSVSVVHKEERNLSYSDSQEGEKPEFHWLTSRKETLVSVVHKEEIT